MCGALGGARPGPRPFPRDFQAVLIQPSHSAVIRVYSTQIPVEACEREDPPPRTFLKRTTHRPTQIQNYAKELTNLTEQAISSAMKQSSTAPHPKASRLPYWDESLRSVSKPIGSNDQDVCALTSIPPTPVLGTYLGKTAPDNPSVPLNSLFPEDSAFNDSDEDLAEELDECFRFMIWNDLSGEEEEEEDSSFIEDEER